MPIHHIILLKFKPGTTAADIDKVRATVRALPSAIPSISELKTGEKIKHPLDKGFDEAILLLFKDESALKEYTANNAHREYLESTEAYIQEKLIFDIDVE